MSSKSSSSNSQKSTTTQTDNRVGIEGEFVQAVGGQNNVVTLTDHGAIAIGGEVIEGGLDVIAEILDLVANAGESIINYGQSQGTAALEAVQAAGNEEETNLADRALKLALPLALIAGVVLVMVYRRR